MTTAAHTAVTIASTHDVGVRPREKHDKPTPVTGLIPTCDCHPEHLL
ncbi:MAG: hypothetical protein GX603_09590 [Chloroflexi bacterium]|nr:hypothetical protein [Chloroflexota bacterium]